MERSDTVPDLLTTPTSELPKREEVQGETMLDKMMRMCLSLRGELYDLYMKHQALLDENRKLKVATGDKDALRDSASSSTEPVLGSDKSDGQAALLLPTVEDAGEKADEGVIPPCSRLTDTPAPNTPKFPLCPCDFRPVSPSDHCLDAPNEESNQP